MEELETSETSLTVERSSDVNGDPILTLDGELDISTADTFRQAVETVLAACKRHGVPIGIHTSSLEWSRRRLEAGFNFVTIGSDAGFVMQGAAASLTAMRGVKAKQHEPTGY